MGKIHLFAGFQRNLLYLSAYKGSKTPEWNCVKWGNFGKFVDTSRYCLEFDSNDVTRPRVSVITSTRNWLNIYRSGKSFEQT
jgi:hypothetical protein